MVSSTCSARASITGNTTWTCSSRRRRQAMPGRPSCSRRNRFTVTRQVHYSVTATGLSLDLVAFVNGLPVFTFELKNNITKQTFDDAVEQYKRDRDPRELLFQFGRCIAHFALDDQQVRFCTHLKGKQSWFLPFDKGWNDGAGNPPNPNGLKTDYLWRGILAPASLANIMENYAQIVTTKNPRTGKKTSAQIFPRYHQLDVVRKLLADVEAQGAGPPLPHSALGRKWEVELHRVAGPPAHRSQAQRHQRLRLRHRGHRPGDPRQPVEGDHQVLHAGRLHSRAC